MPSLNTSRSTSSRCRKARRPAFETLEGRTLLTAGALDTSFGGTGSVVTDLTFQFDPQGVAVQSDLKTVVVGLERTSPTSGFPWNLAAVRYNVNGSLDSTFGSGGEVVLGTNSFLQGNLGQQNASVAIQPDGKIVVATDTLTANSKGSFTSCDMLVLRFNTNGSLDTSFGQSGKTDLHLSQGMTAARAVAVLSTGQIVVAGMNLGGQVGPEFVVARLTSSGALDTTFGPNGRGYNYTTTSSTTADADSVGSLGVDTSGNLLVGGMWLNPSTNTLVDQVVRYTPAGLIDTSFGNQGIDDLPFGWLRGIESIGFQSNGQIILGHANGNSGTVNAGVTRLNPNGTLDTTFGSNGYFTDPNGGGDAEIAVQPNDDILFETLLNPSEGGILVDRLLPVGSLDPAFGTGGEVELSNGAWDGPGGITVGPDGNITGTGIYGSGTVGSATFRLLGDAPVTGQLAVTQQPPASLSAGTPFGLTVQVDDSSGNVETSYNGPVTVAMANNPGGATLGGTTTVTATQGVATFSGLTLTKAASGDTLVVSGGTLGDAVTTPMTVSPLAASQVVIAQEPPSSVVAGSAGFGLQATIEDLYGNVVTSATNTVSVALASNPGGASLGGTLTATASQGLATFSGLTLNKAASGYTLQVSSTSLGSPDTTVLTVTPAAAVGLLIAQQPSSVVVNKAFSLVVEVVDAYGNVVTSDNNSVTIALGNNPTGAKLSGKVSMKFVNGVATFSDLTLNKVGTGYTILISSKSLNGATSGPINVTAK